MEVRAGLGALLCLHREALRQVASTGFVVVARGGAEPAHRVSGDWEHGHAGEVDVLVACTTETPLTDVVDGAIPNLAGRLTVVASPGVG